MLDFLSFYSKQSPAPVASPQLVLLNYSLAAQLGLNIEELTGEKGCGNICWQLAS